MENGEGAAPNGGVHVTKQEHENLRAYVTRRFDEQEKQLKHIADMGRMSATALELLLQERGLDMPQSPGEDDAEPT